MTRAKKEETSIATAKKAELEAKISQIKLSILPTAKPENINFYGGGLPIRVNCQTGNFTNSKQEALGNKMSVNIIKATRYFGDLGMTRGVEWLQIFYIPTKECTFIPQNTVCYSYIKTQSLSQFKELILYVGNQSQEDPAMGIFELDFERKNGNMGTYYVLNSNWRKRESDEEFEQLIKIHDFLQHEPQLEDWVGTAEMVAIDHLSPEEYQEIIRTAQAEKRKEK